MSEFWQWQGDADTGAGYVRLMTLKGAAATVITATLTATLTADATYTSSETSVIGFNSILMEAVFTSGGRTAKVDIAGSLSSGGTMVSMIDKDTSAQMTVTFTANKTVKLIGLPDYLGFTATLSAGMTAGASVAVKILPLNL